MQSSHITAIVIVFIVMIASVLRAKYRGVRHRGGNGALQGDVETVRLREEVKTLRDRLAVIERITVEKENSLEREIERLRDH